MGTPATAFGSFTLDRERRTLMRNGQPIPIGHRGYILLEMLLDAGGAAVSKQVLMDRAWSGLTVEEGNLTVQISTLRRQLGEGADSIIVTVPRVGYRLVAAPLPSSPPAPRDHGGPPLIAVLPFANLGNATEDGYFADGVVDDIITGLSRFKNFAVLSRGASFALRDRNTDARSAAAELGVRYALDGSVRRMGEHIRLTAQLLDATTGNQIWGERYDGPLADIFSFQDRITESVVGFMGPEIRKAEIERARRKPAQNLDAYDLLLRALPMVYAPGIEGHPEGMGLLTRAMELDPTFALPPAYAALIYETRISLRAPPLGNRDAEAAIELARTSLALGSDDPLVRTICAWVLFRVAGDLTAVEAVRRAVETCPNHVDILALAAATVGMHGAMEESIRYHMRAYELSPGAPEAFRSLFGIAGSELVLGNNEAAIEWSLKSLATFNDLLFTYICLTAAYANLDRMDEARAMLRRVREISPHLTIQLIIDGAAREDAFAWAVIPGLRKTGLPES